MNVVPTFGSVLNLFVSESSESEIDVVASTSTSEMAVLAPKRTASKSAEVSASRSKKSRLGQSLNSFAVC